MKSVTFLIFVLYDSHLLAYNVSTTLDFRVFQLRLQLKSAHLKESFPDQLTLVKKEKAWEPYDPFETNLCQLIDEWIIKHVHMQKIR